MNKVLFATILMLLSVTASNSQSNLKIKKIFHIASDGGWDYLTVGPGNKLYVSHGTQVNILDKNTGDSLGVLLNTSGVHGIAFDETNGKGFTSNGKSNNVMVFDCKSNVELARVVTGENPDAILFDGYSKMIVTCNGRSKDLTVLDPVSYSVVATIPVGGKPETLVSDGAGKWFVNIEDKSEIVQVNSKTFVVEKHWPLSPAEGPTGLAIDNKAKRLFAGCDKKLAVVDYTNGKIISTLTIGGGCDGVAFDNKTKTIFTSNGEGTMTIVKEESPDKFKVAGNMQTKKSARTIAIDEMSQTLYLPAAELEPQAPSAQGRPKLISGSFQILVIK